MIDATVAPAADTSEASEPSAGEPEHGQQPASNAPADEETASSVASLDDILAAVQSLEEQGRLVEASALLLQAQDAAAAAQR